MRSRAIADSRSRRAHATAGDSGRWSARPGRWRIGKAGEQRRQAIGQLLELPGVQAAHCPLQCSGGAPRARAQDLLPIRSGMNLNTSLIALMPAPLDPATCDESFQYVAYRGPLHSETCGEARSGNARLLANARKSAMHRNVRIGHPLELAIKRAHAIDERACRQQCISFERASGCDVGCNAHDTFSR